MIERYDNFNAKGYPYEICFCHFHYQLITLDYYNFFNDNDDDDNIIPGASVDYVFPYKKQVEDVFVPNAPTFDSNWQETEEYVERGVLYYSTGFGWGIESISLKC